MINSKKIYDIAIIGAGAAGLMTAVIAKREGLSVLLLDSKAKVGAKILMSGGTRCNLTNQRVLDKDFHTERKTTLKTILKTFTSEQAIEFFKELGIEVVLEPGGKLFPTTHSGRTVLEAFLKELEKLGVELRSPALVSRIAKEGEFFKLCYSDESVFAKTVVLATGGLSFPATGSNGGGYELAKAFGHTLVKTSPSLTPLLTSDEDFKNLSGLSLPVKLTFKENSKKKVSYEGDFLFTHFGFSGPVVLNISRHFIRSSSDQMTVNFLPTIKEEEFRGRLLEESKRNPTKTVDFYFGKFLPKRLVETMFKKLNVSRATILSQLTRKDREALIRNFYVYPLKITGDKGYVKAEVTAGGIDLNEVKKSTLESKLVPGLFFVGEILDVDGRIGGFNFQWAWSSGYAAAKGAKQRVGRSLLERASPSAGNGG